MDEKHLVLAQENNPLFDRFLWRRNYFWCGHTNDAYYNTTFVEVVEFIGKHCDIYNKNSDYHIGIEYIAKHAGVTKTQVKAIRKKFRIRGGYEFKTSCFFVSIIAEIIKALKSFSFRSGIRLKCLSGEFYRDAIVYKQYNAIRIAADDSMDITIRNIAIGLEQMQDVINIGEK